MVVADEEVVGSRGTGPGGYAVHRLVGASGLDEARRRRSQEILRPGGGGDSFAAGLIYGLPATGNLQTALNSRWCAGASSVASRRSAGCRFKPYCKARVDHRIVVATGVKAL
jgi:hypothetical protein